MLTTRERVRSVHCDIRHPQSIQGAEGNLLSTDWASWDGGVVTGRAGRRDAGAFVRDYIAELLPEVLDGTISPGRVFDAEMPLAAAAAAYAAMDERRAVKVLLRP